MSDDKHLSADDFIDHDALEPADPHPADEFIDKGQASALKHYLKSKPKSSEGEALREGFAEGGTFGFAPRIGAAGGALASSAQQSLSGEPEPQSLKDLYNEYLNYNNKLQENAKSSHPELYYTGMLAGGAASPLNKIGALGLGGKTMEAATAAEKAAQAGQAVQTASMPTKMALSGLAGAKIGTLGGLSQSKDLSDIPQSLENAGEGMMFGQAVGAVAPPVGSALKGTAKGLASGLETVFGPVGARFGQGMKAGVEGAPNLATQGGRATAQEARGEFAKDFVNKLRDTVKGNAKNKVQMIEQHVKDLPKDQIDNVLNEILDMDPAKLGSKEAEEFAQIKEEILRAKEGPMQTETVRQYNPGAAPAPVLNPNQQYRPPLNGPGEMMPPPGAPQGPSQGPPPGMDVTPPPPQQLNTGGLQNPPMVQAPAIEGQASRMAPPPEPSPGEFAGYESVHKATIDPADDEARAAFQQKIHEKLADEKALGKNSNDSPVQIEEHPIPGTDKVRLVAKRAAQEEDKGAFKEQAAQIAQKQREDIRLQQLLDKQQEEAAKMRAQQEAAMAQPQFQDVQQDVRAGNRNIQSPQELYKLQQLLQSYGNPVSGRLATEDMRRVAGQASGKLGQVLKQNVGTTDVDAALHAFNNIGEVMNIDPAKLQLPGGSGEAAKENALTQVFKLINPESLSDKDLVNKEKMQYIADQLKVISPDLSTKFLDNVEKQAQSKDLLKEFSKPYEPSGINPEFNIVRRLATKASYGAGYRVGEQANKIATEVGPAIQAGQKIFSKYSPQSLQDMSARALSSGDETIQQFGQVLSKLATADERTRNSMIFVLEQQAGYKAMMQGLMEPQEKKSSQMKDKSLQKFK